MRAVWAIARREVRALLHTATGWLVLGGFLFLTGAFWLALVDNYLARSGDLAYDPYSDVRMSLVDHLLAPFFGNVAILLLVVCPAVTMRSFADEQRLGTIDLLATSPVSAWQIALGKLGGAWAFVGLLLASTLWMPLALTPFGRLDPGALLGGYLSLGLLGATLCALGTLASALTDQALVALVLSFSVTLVLWIVGWLNPDPTSLVSQVSIATHVSDMARGALRASDVAYFVLLCGWSLVALQQRVASWRYA